MENKEISIKDFEQAIELLQSTIKNKSKIKDEKGNEVEMLISYTEGNNHILFLNGRQTMVVGNVLAMFRRLSGLQKIEFLYNLAVVMRKMAEEVNKEISTPVNEIDITELTKTGNA